MLHWAIIILGIILLTLSISNPFYKLIIKKNVIFSNFVEVIFRIILFLIAIIVLFFGLYVESIF